jgi:predicted nuclease with TOPRIM domain
MKDKKEHEETSLKEKVEHLSNENNRLEENGKKKVEEVQKLKS